MWLEGGNRILIQGKGEDNIFEREKEKSSQAAVLIQSTKEFVSFINQHTQVFFEQEETHQKFLAETMSCGL